MTEAVAEALVAVVPEVAVDVLLAGGHQLVETLVHPFSKPNDLVMEIRAHTRFPSPGPTVSRPRCNASLPIARPIKRTAPVVSVWSTTPRIS